VPPDGRRGLGRRRLVDELVVEEPDRVGAGERAAMADRAGMATKSLISSFCREM
jgi:hypothetical protein